jgi:hypothetical protein
MTIIIPPAASPAFQDRAISDRLGITDALVQAMSDAAGRNWQTLVVSVKLRYRVAVEVAQS